MKTKLLIIIPVIIIIFLISFAIPNLSKVYDSCKMTQNGILQFAIGYQWTNGFLYIDNAECTWNLFGVIPIISIIDNPKTAVSDNTIAQLEAILEHCIDSKDLVDTVGLSYYNNTHSIDTVTCEWQNYNGEQINSEELGSNWIADEDYCQEWCDNEELYKMECDQPILAHLVKYSNLLDEEFNGKYVMEDIGLSDGVSVEKFNECVDFIYEKRISYEFDKTWGGPGNRYPGFLGWNIPDICTQDMVKFLKKNSNMFDKDLPYGSPLDGDVTGFGINPDDMVQCENELLDNRDNEPSWPGN